MEYKKSYRNPKICYIFQEKLEDKHATYKKYCTLGTIVIIQVNIEVLHIAYVIESMVWLKKFL